MTDLAIRAESVSKSYRLYDTAADRLRELVFRRPRHREFRALSDVSFELPRGCYATLIVKRITEG